MWLSSYTEKILRFYHSVEILARWQQGNKIMALRRMSAWRILGTRVKHWNTCTSKQQWHYYYIFANHTLQNGMIVIYDKRLWPCCHACRTYALRTMIPHHIRVPVMVDTISLVPVSIIHVNLHWMGFCGDDVCEHGQKISSLSFEFELSWTELQDTNLVYAILKWNTIMFGPCNVYKEMQTEVKGVKRDKHIAMDLVSVAMRNLSWHLMAPWW